LDDEVELGEKRRWRHRELVEEQAASDGLANDCDGRGEEDGMEDYGHLSKPETKPKDKQRAVCDDDRIMGPGWYRGSGLEGFIEDCDLPPMYCNPFMKIMRVFGGQGKCWLSLIRN